MDRRRAARYQLSTPARVYLSDQERPDAVVTTTRDACSTGMFLEWSNPPAAGTELRVELELPVPLSSTPLHLMCRCRVVRVDSGSSGKRGAAVEILSYEANHR